MTLKSRVGAVMTRWLERAGLLTVPWRQGGELPVRGWSGVLGTGDYAMRISAVSACVRLVAGNVAKLPLHVYEREGEERRRLRDNVVETLLNRKPNAWQTPHEFRRMMTAHVALSGNAYALKQYEGATPTALIPMEPGRVVVEQEAFDLPPTYRFSPGNGRTRTYTAGEIFHLRDLTLDGIVGLSRIEQARQGISLAFQAETYGTAFFQNGTEVGLVVEVPRSLTPDQREGLRKALDAQHGGASRAHGPAVLEGGAKMSRLGMSNRDSQFLELRSFQVEDIARLYGVPPHMIGLTEKQTSYGTGVEHMAQGFLQFHLLDWLVMWETAIRRDLLGDSPNVYAEHLVEGLLRADYKTRMEGYAQGIQNGVLSPNECRKFENLPPRKGGDEFWRPVNMGNGAEPPPLRPKATLPGERPRDRWRTAVLATERVFRNGHSNEVN